MYESETISVVLFFLFILGLYFALDNIYAAANDILSNAIQCFLVWRYPIRNIQDGRSIPTCPYRWPDGQGDVGKFLQGEANREKWAKAYGNVYRLWAGPVPEIVLRNPLDIKNVFWDSDKHTKASKNDSGWLMGELLGQCVGLISGESYRKLRAVTSPPFSHHRVSMSLNRIVDVVKKHLDDLFAGRPSTGIYINPVKDLRLLPFWIVAEMVYGTLSDGSKEELRDIIPLRESLWARMIQGGSARYSWSRYFLTRTGTDLQNFKTRWARFNHSTYEAGLKQTKKPAILSMYAKVNVGSIPEEQVLQTLDEMIFANLDVTMGNLSWAVLFLAAHQDVQDQLRQEIQIARESKSSWNYYLQNSSSLLAACILEAVRLKPLAAFTVPQAAPTDRVVSGYLVPAGTNFVVDTHALNIGNPFWGEDREIYRPARFLTQSPSEMRYHFWRFGFGPRQCLGRYAADLIIRVTVSHLVENFRLALTENTHWSRNPDTWIVHPDTEICCDKLE